VLVFLPELSQRGLEGIGGGAPSEVDKLVAVILSVGLRNHLEALKSPWRTYSHKTRIRAMGENENRDGRKVLVLPNSPEGLFGPHRRAAVETMALLLSNAIADSLDRIPMFNRGGQPVLLIDGALRVVNAELLGWLVEAHFTTPHVVEKAGRLELEYRGVRANEMVLRHMLVTTEGKHGGLLGRLPVLRVEEPQVAVEEKPQKATPSLLDDHPEVIAGRRELAKHADAAARLELEKARGAETLAKYQGRQAAVETPMEDSIPMHLPEKPNDAAVDPAGTRA
jgi:hypothetical protein